MLFIAFFLFAQDFTIEAGEGMWIDYARTGYLSENRYILVQHKGKKGTYDQGSSRVVLDAAGEELYALPGDGKVWLNGLLGDEDTYVQVPTTGDHLVLWHPSFGEVTLEHQHLNHRKRLVRYALAEDGRTFYLVSRLNVGEKGTIRFKTQVEELQIKAAGVREVFETPEATYRRVVFSEEMELAVDRSRFLFYSSKHEPYYLDMPFAKDGSKPRPVEVKTPFRISSLASAGDYLAVGMPDGGLVLQKGADRRLIELKEDDGTPAYRYLKQLLNGFWSGAVQGSGDEVTFVDAKGSRLSLDTRDMKLRKYREHLGEGMSRHPNARSAVFCNDKEFRVRRLDRKNAKNEQPVLELDVPSHYLIAQKPKPEKNLEK